MELIKWDKIRHQIETSKDIEELTLIKDKLRAYQILAEQSKQSMDVQAKIAIYKARADRKCGEWLKDNIEHGGQNKKARLDNVTSLKELKLSKFESSRLQKIANIPTEKFESILLEAEIETKKITNNMLVSIAKESEKERKKAEIIKAGATKNIPANIQLLEGDLFDVIDQIPDSSIDLLCTDPPYLVMNDYEWDKKDLIFLDKWLKVIKPKLKKDYLGFIFCDARMMFEFEGIIRNYFDIKNHLIWIRKNMANGRVIKNRFISSYEIIFYFGNKELNLPDTWGNERFDSFEYATPQSNFKEGKYHPTQKPLELFRRLIMLGSKEGETVLDCFAGSGTTGIICKELNRNGILIEKEQEYINIIRGRL